MKLISLTLLAIICCLSLGCNAPGIRLAPGEPIKISAEAAHELSTALVASGAAPNDPSLRALSSFTRPPANYAGSPSEPMDIAPLAASSQGKWDSLRLRNTMNELRERCGQKTAEMVSRKLALVAKQIASVEEGKNIPRAEAIAMISPVQDFQKMATEFRLSIRVPAEKETPQDTLDAIAAMQADMLDTLEAANRAAALKATNADVANEVIGQTNGVLDYAGEVLQQNPDLSYLLGLVGLGGGGVWLKKRATGRRVAKDAKDKADKAEERKDREADAIGAALVKILADKPVK